jgi:hypothetical protein
VENGYISYIEYADINSTNFSPVPASYYTKRESNNTSEFIFSLGGLYNKKFRIGISVMAPDSENDYDLLLYAKLLLDATAAGFSDLSTVAQSISIFDQQIFDIEQTVQPTGTTIPTGIVNPTDVVIPQTTVPPVTTPITTIYPTGTVTSGDYQCGQTGCTKDSDCATGLPEYECDESSTNWPDNNKCIKVCPSGETRIDDCTCSGSGGLYQCGPIDIDSNGLINYIDLANFRKVYNKTCSDSPYQGGGCKGADTNNDGRINYKDLSSFASRYYPKALTCNL